MGVSTLCSPTTQDGHSAVVYVYIKECLQVTGQSHPPPILFSYTRRCQGYQSHTTLIRASPSYPSSSGRSGLLLKLGNFVALLQAHCHLVLRSHGDWGEKELPVKPKTNIRTHTTDRSSHKTVINSSTLTHLTSTFRTKTEKDCACA